jgi:HTH-type transcriptional regulator/antitoxin HigA
MEQQTTLRAAKKFGPGYFIKEQMEYRQWTQEDLADVMGLTLKHINSILQNKQAITFETAKILAEIFETTPQYWLNLDAQYRLWLLNERTKKEMEADIKGLIYERMPIKDMLQKGWLKPFTTLAALNKQVLKFWNWPTLDFTILDQQYLPCLTRKSEAYNQYQASYAITWYRKAYMEADKIQVPKYQPKKLEALYNTIAQYTAKPKGISLFLNELKAVGVKFLVLPHLQKTYLDGAAFMQGKNPVIVYTGRYKRIDNFWFTLAHEIAHVLLHLNNETPFILDNLREQNNHTIENEANALAAEKLKHTEIKTYLSPYIKYLSAPRVEACAAHYQIHPAIIIGKLAHDHLISYANQTLYNQNVLTLIPISYQVKK